MSPAPFNVLGQCYQFCFMGCGLCFCTTQFITCLCSFELVKPRGRHGVSSIPQLELMVNSEIGIGIDYLKKYWIGIENFLIWSFLQKSFIQNLIYHFYNVNTYMWCYQYTGTIMIESFGSCDYHSLSPDLTF